MKNLEWEHFDKEYLEKVFSEAKDLLKATIIASENIQKRINDIMRFAMGIIIGLFVFLCSTQAITSEFYTISFVALVNTLVILGFTIYLWWFHSRIPDGFLPDGIEHLTIKDETNDDKYRLLLFTLIVNYNKAIEDNLSKNEGNITKTKHLILGIFVAFAGLLTWFCVLSYLHPYCN